MIRLTSRTPAGVANLDYPQNCFYPDGTKDQVAVSAYRQKAIDRLAAYEDTGLEAEEIKERLKAGETLFFERSDLYAELGPIEHLRELAKAEHDGRLVVLPSNDPLTLDELREMDGEPVWITPSSFWALVIARPGERVKLISNDGEVVFADKEIELVGPVYRHKPEKGAEHGKQS